MNDVSAYFNSNTSQNVLSRHSARQATSLHRICALQSRQPADRFERADRACQTDERSLTIPRRFFAEPAAATERVAAREYPREQTGQKRGGETSRGDDASHQPSRRLKSIGKYLSATRVSFPARVIFICRRGRHIRIFHGNCGNDSCLLVVSLFSSLFLLFSSFFFSFSSKRQSQRRELERKEKATVTDRHFPHGEGRQTRNVSHTRWKNLVYVTAEDQSRRREVIEKETWIWVSLRRLEDSHSRTIFYVRSNLILRTRQSPFQEHFSLMIVESS